MLKGQIVVKVTSANSKMNTIQTESKDFSTAETASYLFLAWYQRKRSRESF